MKPFICYLISQLDDEDVFTWTAQEQAYVLSGYFWGSALTSAAAGVVAERWGPRNVVFVTMLGGSVLTVVSPWMARMDYKYLAFARFLIGLLGVSLVLGDDFTRDLNVCQSFRQSRTFSVSQDSN